MSDAALRGDAKSIGLLLSQEKSKHCRHVETFAVPAGSFLRVFRVFRG
jgi:hypothetical protein